MRGSKLQFAVVMAGLLLAVWPARADQAVVSEATEQALIDALTGDNVDNVIFDLDATITLSGPIELAKNMTIDANGHAVTINGGKAGSIFIVDPGYHFTLAGLALTGGYSTNGGGLYINRNATVLVTNCLIMGNVAQGGNGQGGANGNNGSGDGQDGAAGAVGTNAFGGGIYNLGRLSLISCTLASNSVVGGLGGNGGNGGNGNTNWSSHHGGNGGRGGVGGTAFGGAIYNAGSLILSNTSLLDNSAAGGAGGAGGTNGMAYLAGLAGQGAVGGMAAGGAIFSTRPLTAVNCTFAQNSAVSGASVGGGTAYNVGGPDAPNGPNSYGGGIFAAGGALTNCTLVTNSATGGTGGVGGTAVAGGTFLRGGRGGDGGKAVGGGIYVTGAVAMVHCTVAFCTANSGTNGPGGTGTPPGLDGNPGLSWGGGIACQLSKIFLMNSILATNFPGSNTFGAILDGGYNISSDPGPYNFGRTSRLRCDPKIKPLADNGGPTNIAGGILTIALYSSSSPAYGVIPTNTSNYVISFDQRLGPRPGGGKSRADIGAYEIGPPYIPDTANPFAYYPPTNGGSVTLRVLPVGDSPLRYFWQFNDKPLGNSNGPSLYLASVTNGNVGPYSVIVSNVYGKYVSADVNIHFIPGIGLGPTNTIVQAGKPVTLNVWATGNIGDTSYRYQWRSAPPGVVPTNIPGAFGITTDYTNNVYTIPSPTTNDSRQYCVVITNNYGSITSPVCALSVDQIVNDLTNQTVVRGSTAHLRVGVVGSASLTYAWFKNGTAQDQGNGASSFDDPLTNDASYYVKVQDGTDLTMLSATAFITVVSSSPTNVSVSVATNSTLLTNQLGSLDVAQGTAVALSNSATGGGLSYQWRLNGNAIPGATNRSYLLSAAQFSDSGRYEVSVTNLLGSVISAIQLNVLPMLSNAQVFLSGYQATGVRTVGANAYLTLTNGSAGRLLSLDISNPAAPKTNGYLDLAGPGLSLFVSGANAYVACGSNGLEVVDVSNPASLVALATNHSAAFVQSCFVTNGYAYLACGANGLQILEVSAPSAPVVVAAMPLNQAEAVWLGGTNAYVAAGTNGLVVFGLENNTNAISTNRWADGSNLLGVRVSGANAYLAASAAGVKVVDVSNSTNLMLSGSSPSPRAAQALALTTGYLAVADGTNGVVLLDVTAPAQPRLVGISPVGDVRDVDISGQYVYAAAAGGLVVLDASPTLRLPPAIRTQPQSLTLLLGSNAVFSVVATGTMPLGYQWRSNAVALAEGPTGSGSTIAGSTSSSLAVGSVQAADAANGYTVVVSNSYGAVTSAVAQIVLQACAYTLSADVTISAGGTNDSFFVTNSGACSWSASASERWIHTASSGVGGGTVAYTVDSNTNSSARIGSIFVADANANTITQFNITQEAYFPPIYSLWLNSVSPDSDVSVGLSLFDLNGNNTLTTVSGQWVYAQYYSNTLVKLMAPGFVNDTSAFVKWQTNGVDASSSQSLSLLLTADIDVTAVYRTPFTFLTATYNGLFFDTNLDETVSQTCSGSCKITTTSKAGYSAALQIGGARYSFSGQFNTNSGSAAKTLRNRDGSTLSLNLQLVAEDPDFMLGAVTNTTTNGELSAGLVADRSTFDGKNNMPNQVGAYTMIIPGDTNFPAEPVGDGYGTVTLGKTGIISWAGALADGTKLTQSSTLSKDGYWPLYVPLYSGKGSVLGWMYFTNSTLANQDGVDWGVNAEWWDSGLLSIDLSVSGAFNWIKPPLNNTKYYPQGFAVQRTNVWGLRYTPPAYFQNGLFTGTGEIILSGGDFAGPLTNYVTVNVNNSITSTNKASLSIARGNGTFSGRVNYPVTNITSRLVKKNTVYQTNVTLKAVSFSGVILTNAISGVGAGCFLGTNQSGRVIFQEQR